MAPYFFPDDPLNLFFMEGAGGEGVRLISAHLNGNLEQTD